MMGACQEEQTEPPPEKAESEDKMNGGYKPTTWYYVSVFVASFGGSFQFYSINVMNPLAAYVKDWLNDTFIERGYDMSKVESSTITVYWSIVSSSILIGALLGTLIMRVIAERVGRRNGILVNTVTNLVGVFLATTAELFGSPELLVAGRFLIGISVGVIAGLVPMYLTEISQTDHRGFAGATHMVAIAFGDLLSLLVGLPELLGTSNLWPYACMIPGIPACLMLAILPFCPESPRYLLMLDQPIKAKRAVRKLVPNNVNAQDTVALMQLDEELCASGQSDADADRRDTIWHNLKSIWSHRALHMPLALCVLVMIAQQFTGNVAVFMYSTDIFTKASLSIKTAQVSTAVIGGAYFVSALVSLQLIDRAGRRPLLLTQLSVCSVTLALLAVSIGLTNHLPTAADWTRYTSIALLAIYMLAYGIGCSVPWLVASELFEQRYRATAVTVSTVVSFSLSVMNSLAYEPFQQAVGPELSFLPYIAIMCVCIYLLARNLPETKNRTIHEIVESFQARVHRHEGYRIID